MCNKILFRATIDASDSTANTMGNRIRQNIWILRGLLGKNAIAIAGHVNSRSKMKQWPTSHQQISMRNYETARRDINNQIKDKLPSDQKRTE